MNVSAEPSHSPIWLKRWPWLIALVVIAVVYYGSYYRHGINFRDEGGTLTLCGMRLLDGQIPFRDVELGYNVGWFLPITGLFSIVGVDFVALRIFFMALCTLTAVLGFLTVERAARHAGRRALALPLGFATGLLLVLVPGMLFKNYNPLAAVANSWALLSFVLSRTAREACWRALVGGLILGATWLVRIDLGTFFSVLWIGTLVLRAVGPPGKLGERFAVCIVSLLILLFGAAAIHGPVVWDAYRRNYAKEFIGSYSTHWKMMMNRLPGIFKTATPSPAKAETPATTPAAKADPVAAAPAAVAAAQVPAPARRGAYKSETLPRTTWSDVQKADEKSKDEVLGLFLLTYLPLLVILPLVGWALTRWVRTVRSCEDSSGPLGALVLLGGALTMFPQFFFWRPDSPHLSEFGPGYWTAVIGATALLGAGMSWRAPARWLTVLIFLQCGVWLWRMLPDRWCGTIAARSARKTLFEGENGTRVYEQKKTIAWMNDVVKIIQQRSGSNDYLVAYPYHPTFNVIANRPTYEKNVYIDNAKAGLGWGKAAIQRIQQNRPAIIVISDWDVNGTEASRFRNWGNDVYLYVRANYEYLGVYDEKEKFEIYARKPLGEGPKAADTPPPVTPAPAAPPQ